MKKVVAGLLIIIGFMALLGLLATGSTGKKNFSKKGSRPNNSNPAQASAPAASIEPQLEPPAGIVSREGTGILVLLDTSGSMKELVANAAGQNQPKIEIARQALLEIVRVSEKYAREHPQQLLELGISEFSMREGQPSCRMAVPLGAPSVAVAEPMVNALASEGGTPIGDALIAAKKTLDLSGLTRKHILVITDGENTYGYAPLAVLEAQGRIAEAARASIYFVAFDIAAQKFNALREAGALVQGAANGGELQATLDYIVSGKILVEQLEAPKVK